MDNHARWDFLSHSSAGTVTRMHLRVLSQFTTLVGFLACLTVGCDDGTTSTTSSSSSSGSSTSSSGGDLTPASILVSNSRGDDIVRYAQDTGAFVDVFIPKGTGGLFHPDTMIIGPDGALYISSGDTPATSAILRFDAKTGAFQNEFAKGNGLHRPYGIAFGKDGKLYVSSFLTDELLRYDGKTGAFVDVFKKGDGMPGGLNGPNILAFGPDDQLYVTTQGSVAVNGEATFPGLPSQVLKINPATGELSVFIDQPMLSPAGHGFISLLGIVFDPGCTASCNLYISDFANDIRVYDWPGGMLKQTISTNYTGTMPSGNFLGAVTLGENGNIFTAGFATADGNVGTVLRFDSMGDPLPAMGQSGAILVNADMRLNRPIGILALPKQ